MRVAASVAPLFLLFLASCTLLRDEPDQCATITPDIIAAEEGAIQNAGAGAEIWNGGPGNGVTNLVKYAVRVSDNSVNSMIRVGWDAYETKEGVYHFEKMDKQFVSGIQYPL